MKGIARIVSKRLTQKGILAKKMKKKLHVWAAIGWNFKSGLVFYDVPGNSNGKMSHQAYLGNILEPIVKPWIQQVQKGQIDPFVLEEDVIQGMEEALKRTLSENGRIQVD